MTRRNTFQPNYSVPPGEILGEILEACGMTTSEFARRAGRPERVLSEILHTRAPITPEMAVPFERVLGRPAGFWLQLQARWDGRRREIPKTDRDDFEDQ
jgi:addiction module HigA family antidote